MTPNRVDLANIFSTVTQSLAENQAHLNQADEYNHDHGSNMVQTFQTITSSLQQKQGKSASTALSYAAKKLATNTNSSSGKLYAQALTQAASNFKGKQVDSRGALDLLQTLIGGGQGSSQSSGGDMLGSMLGQLTGGISPQAPSGSSQSEDIIGALLGQFTGGTQPQSAGASSPGSDLLSSLLGQSTGSAPPKPSPTAPQGADVISNLLGSMTGTQASSTSGTGSGLDLGDVLNAGMTYMQAKQQGVSTAEALVQAFMSASGMGNSTHRTQSTSLVVNSFLNALASSGKKP